jgi:hypothetical protein
MKQFRSHILLLQLLWIGEVGYAQQIRFRDVLGNTGYDYGMSAQQTFDKGYIVCGSTTSVGNGNTDIYIIKTDSLGKPVNECSIGGINVEQGTCIRQTKDSGYVVLGYTNHNSYKGYDVYVVKIDAKLHTQWERTYGGTDWDFGYSIRQTSDEGYIICGGTYSYGKGDEDYYLLKTNAQGDTLWTRTFGGNQRDEARSVIQTSDGGYAITGFTMSSDSLGNFLTIKTNSTGDTLWTNTFGGSQLDKANDIVQLSNGDYAVAGETKSSGAGKSDGILVGISASGKTGNTALFGGAEDDNLLAVTERSDHKIMFTGVTNSYGFTNGKGDLYFGMVNSDWSYFMSTTFGSVGKETVNSIGATSDKGAIICGTTNGFRNLLDDIYLVKTDSTGFSSTKETVLVTNITEDAKQQPLNFALYPNPGTETVYLNIHSPSQVANMAVYDLTGRLLKSQDLHLLPDSTVSLAVTDLADGIYFVKITTLQMSLSKRLLVKHD